MQIALTSGDLTSTHSTEKYPLGTRFTAKHATYGEQEYMFVKNDSGASIAAYLGVMVKNGADTYNVALSGANISRTRFVGVTHVAIADGYYGWVKTRGAGITITDDGSAAGITANGSFECAASGKFVLGTVGTDDLIGHVGTAIGVGATGPAFIK